MPPHKQGVSFRLLPFIGLNAQQIGDESMLRNIVKMRALCWTRFLYRYPLFVAKAWESWHYSLTPDEQANVPATLPKDWRKDKWASDSVLRVCPACNVHRTDHTKECMGTLEHMHLYCASPHLVKARAICYEGIETSLESIYNFASYVEYNKPTPETSRQTKLQEWLENTARQTELEERPICRDAKVHLESTSNRAILTRYELQTYIMLNNIPAEKLAEYDKFPLTHRTGLLPCIPEDDLAIESATITDVTFLGLFHRILM